MSVNFYQTTRPNNPEDSHLHTRHRENLKYHLEIQGVHIYEHTICRDRIHFQKNFCVDITELVRTCLEFNEIQNRVQKNYPTIETLLLLQFV
jgi:hypothetical protein